MPVTIHQGQQVWTGTPAGHRGRPEQRPPQLGPSLKVAWASTGERKLRALAL